MSKYISSNQFWDTICKNLSYPNSPRGENNIYFEEQFGNVNINHYSTGFGIIYSSFIANFYDNTILENNNSYDSSFISFNKGNKIYMQDASKKDKMLWDTDICLNGKQQQTHISKAFYEKDKRNEVHYIGFSNDLFKEFVENNSGFKNIKCMYESQYICVNFNNFINTQQKILLNDLLKIPIVEDKLQVLYLESKLLDLIYISINSIENLENKDKINLSSQDMQSLIKAKKVLLKDMENPPSIKQLAHICAINEFKLKKGFKQLFGNTVYGLLQETRLNKAKKLLETNEINVNEASLLVGYKCTSHFSKIFKNYFGVTPFEIKKENRSKIYY